MVQLKQSDHLAYNIMIKGGKKNKRGFTLIEFLFYIGLFAVFFVALFAVLDISYKNKLRNINMLEVEQQGLFISQVISQEIRNAQSIVDASSSLSLQAFDISRDPVVFYLSDDAIYFSEGLDSPENLSSSRVNISDLSFVNISALDGIQAVEFSFKVSSSDKGHDYSKDFFGAVNLNLR